MNVNALAWLILVFIFSRRPRNPAPRFEPQWTMQQLEQLAMAAGCDDPHVAAAIAMAESGGNPSAIGDNGKSIGLWQIHMPSHREYSRDVLMTPDGNASAMSAIHAVAGWRPWSTWWADPKQKLGPGQGPYKKYL